MVVYTCNPNTQEAEALDIWGQPWQQSETLSQKSKEYYLSIILIPAFMPVAHWVNYYF